MTFSGNYRQGKPCSERSVLDPPLFSSNLRLDLWDILSKKKSVRLREGRKMAMENYSTTPITGKKRRKNKSGNRNFRGPFLSSVLAFSLLACFANTNIKQKCPHCGIRTTKSRCTASLLFSPSPEFLKLKDRQEIAPCKRTRGSRKTFFETL